MNRMQAVKNSVRRLAARALFLSGAANLYRRLSLRERIVVLMYHRIAPEEDGTMSPLYDGMRVDPPVFEGQMAYLRDEYRLLSVGDLRLHLQEGVPFPPRSCLVTFDDGWKDNYTHAYPVLREYGVPAVIFLSVGHIGGSRTFWQERVFRALIAIRDAAGRNGDFTARHREVFGKLELRDLPYLPAVRFQASVRGYLESLKRLPLNRIEPIVEELSKCAGSGEGGEGRADAFLSWEEVSEMSKGGIDFGSHGLTHEILTNVSRDAAREEIRSSKAMLEERTGTKVYAFSYPNGAHNPEVRECVAECGYEIAFGTCGGFAGRADDPLTLKRINVHNDVTREIPMFVARILRLL